MNKGTGDLWLIKGMFQMESRANRLGGLGNITAGELLPLDGDSSKKVLIFKAERGCSEDGDGELS